MGRDGHHAVDFRFTNRAKVPPVPTAIRPVFLLSLFRAATSLSLAVAYQWIASSGVASTIHFMYPLAISLAMICFFRERGNGITFLAIGLSIAGAFGITLILTAVTLVSFKRQNA